MARGLRGLRRIPERGVVAGICAGIADYFDWNVKLLRALLVVGILFSGIFPLVVLYAILWYALDPMPADALALSRPGADARPSAGDVRARFARLDERLRRIEECVTDREFELRRELRKLET